MRKRKEASKFFEASFLCIDFGEYNLHKRVSRRHPNYASCAEVF
jgi:hypothetical protein